MTRKEKGILALLTVVALALLVVFIYFNLANRPNTIATNENSPPPVKTPAEVQKMLESIQAQVKKDFLNSSSSQGTTFEKAMEEATDKNLSVLKKTDPQPAPTDPEAAEKEAQRQKTQDALKAYEAERAKGN